MAEHDHGGIPRLVLEKIGFDLRPKLEPTLQEPLPSHLQKLADEVDGYVEWRDVGPGAAPAEPEPVECTGHEPPSDDAFRFK